MNDTIKYVSTKTHPEILYNIAGRLPKPLPPVLHPGRSSHRARRPRAALPMELILQEVSTEREIRIPEPCGMSTGMAAHAALPRAAPGKGAADPAAHLLQVRGRVARGSHKPNTPWRRPSTTSRRA